jgi:hemerythrin-like domain-containing protein
MATACLRNTTLPYQSVAWILSFVPVFVKRAEHVVRPVFVAGHCHRKEENALFQLLASRKEISDASHLER